MSTRPPFYKISLSILEVQTLPSPVGGDNGYVNHTSNTRERQFDVQGDESAGKERQQCKFDSGALNVNWESFYAKYSEISRLHGRGPPCLWMLLPPESDWCRLLRCSLPRRLS